MREVFGVLVVVALCASCASAPEPTFPGLEEPDPCAFDEDTLTDFPLYATGCPVFIDRQGISPEYFNEWARTTILLTPTEPQGWVDMQQEYLQAFAWDVLVDRAIAEDRYSPDPATLDAIARISKGSPKEYARRLEEASAQYRSAEEVEAMWRRTYVRDAFACSRDGCIPTDDTIEAFYDENVASTGQTLDEARDAIEAELFVARRAEAYTMLKARFAGTTDVEYRTEVVQVRGAQPRLGQ